MFSGCIRQQLKEIKLAGQVQGTYYSIMYYDFQPRSFQKQIDSVFALIDYNFSLYNPNSLLVRINKNDTSILLNEHFIKLYNMSYQISDKTGGAFDITIGALVNAYGFGASLKNKIDSLSLKSKNLYNYKSVRIEQNKLIKNDSAIRLNFNAIAQGYTADLLGEFFEHKGIKNYIIDVGGEVLAKGRKTNNKQWKVGIEKPAPDKSASREIWTTVFLDNAALSTSGTYRNYIDRNGSRYSHTINPHTKQPVSNNLLSVSVKAESCAVADGYATAFMVMGLDSALKFAEKDKTIAAYFIYKDKSGKITAKGTNNFKTN